MNNLSARHLLSFEHKLNLVFATLVAMLLGLFVFTYFSYTKFVETANWVSQTNRVMYFNEQIITDALNIETASSSYAITGSDVFLEPFEQAETDAKNHFTILRRLTKNDPRRLKDFERMEKQFQLKEELSRKIIDIRKSDGAEAVSAYIQKGESRMAMENLRALIKKMQEEEIGLLEERQATHLKWLRWFNSAMFVTVVLMVLLIVFAALTISRNFNQRKRAERELASSKQILQSVIDNTSTLIYIKDINGKILLANRQFGRAIDMPSEKLVGKLDSELFPPEEVEHFRKADQKVFQNGEVIEAEEPVEMQGQKRIYLSVKFPLYNEANNIYALGGMSTDITERKKAEEKILELNTSLEASVFRLKNINRELEAFTYSVSHDLRAPLRAINGFASLLISKAKNHMDEECLRIANIIKDNSQQMGQLIDDLLAFSRIGRYKPKLQETDMRELANMVLQQLTLDYPQNKISINVKSLDTITCDPGLIKQVWVNLISNALKYSSKREVQQIEIGSRSNSLEVVYYVKDNGAGFDMIYYDKLFGIFQRLHTNNEFEGTGVGLAIVHRIVKRHSGRVWAESKPNEGTTFYFSLPKVAKMVDV